MIYLQFIPFHDESFWNLFLFLIQILRNGAHLLQKSNHWRKHIQVRMNFILELYQHKLKQKEPVGNILVRDTCGNAILGLQWMIVLFLHHNKSKEKYQKCISTFHQKLNELYNNVEKKVIHMNEGWALQNVKLVKDCCCQLIELINDKPIIDISGYILRFGDKVWIMKKREIECSWKGCNIKAKDVVNGKLYKCTKCRVARYCSKYCQKRDWKYGNHKHICKKLVKFL